MSEWQVIRSRNCQEMVITVNDPGDTDGNLTISEKEREIILNGHQEGDTYHLNNSGRWPLTLTIDGSGKIGFKDAIKLEPKDVKRISIRPYVRAGAQISVGGLPAAAGPQVEIGAVVSSLAPSWRLYSGLRAIGLFSWKSNTATAEYDEMDPVLNKPSHVVATFSRSQSRLGIEAILNPQLRFNAVPWLSAGGLAGLGISTYPRQWIEERTPGGTIRDGGRAIFFRGRLGGNLSFTVVEEKTVAVDLDAEASFVVLGEPVNGNMTGDFALTGTVRY